MAGVAIFGAGRIGKVHASTLRNHPDSSVLYVADVQRAAAEELARTCGARVASVEVILADEAVDAVIIASPTDTHAELIKLSAAAGKAIFCEKPLDLDIGKAKESLGAAAAAGVRLYIGFNRRHDPGFEELHRQISEGRIGCVEVVTIINRALPPLHWPAGHPRAVGPPPSCVADSH